MADRRHPLFFSWYNDSMVLVQRILATFLVVSFFSAVVYPILIQAAAPAGTFTYTGGVTSLLVHGDGADASTSFSDASGLGNTVTASGNAQVDTAQSKFGGASVLFDGTGDYLSSTATTSYVFGTGDFTVDFWVRPNGNLSTTPGMHLIGNRAVGCGETSWNIESYGATNNIQMHTCNTIVFDDTDNLVTGSAWNHIAWVRSGTTGYLFINGTLVEQVTDSRNYSTSAAVMIGQDGYGGTTANLNGWMDEIRVSKGIARWTANFTPDTSPYADNAAYTFTVPPGVTSIKAKVWGGGGGGGAGNGAAGGGGGYAFSELAVTPGETLLVNPGLGGTQGSCCSGSAAGGPGGASNSGRGGHGGAAGPSGSSAGGGGGGGGSFIVRSSTVLIAAGGGGGGPGAEGTVGGAGGAGGVNGSDGNCSSVGGTTGGAATSRGGDGGRPSGDASGAGAGGGGYLGGTGGTFPSCDTSGGAGGGGGSNYGTVTTNGSGVTPGNNTDSYYSSGKAVGGGDDAAGTAGYIVIYYGGLTITSDAVVTGDASVIGTISKGSGTFVIDHPLDPKNKLLYHSFVESPEVKNMYDGVVTLDDRGEAVIRLPDYFIPLNREYRYLVSPIGDSMPDLHLKRGVRREWFFGAPSFRIAGGKPGGTISWQITGIRQDPFIQKYPIIPEVEKGPGQIVNKGECIFEPLCE